MNRFPITKAFQQNELPLGWIEFTDEALDWLTGALFEESVEFSSSFIRDPNSGVVRLKEIAIVPRGMRLTHKGPGIVVLKGADND